MEQGILMSDDEFKEIVQELRKNGVVTQVGAQEVLSKKNIQSIMEKNDREKSLTTNQNEDGNKSNLFDGKESFLEEASRKVAEASKNPIYKRDSCHQQKVLRRVSVFEWENMSKRWQSNESFLLDEDLDDEVIVHRCNRSSLVSVDSMNDSMSMSSNMKKGYDFSEDNDDANVTSLSENPSPINDRCEGRQSKLFYLNVDDRHDDDDLDDSTNTMEREERRSRSKSILIAIEKFTLLYDDDNDDDNFAILEADNVQAGKRADTSTFALRELCSHEADIPSSSFSSSFKQNAKGRQERRRAIKVNEVFCASGDDCKMESNRKNWASVA